MRTRYLEFVDREARYSRKYGTDHTSVVNLRDQISELRRSISEELKKVQESHLSDYEIAKQQEQDLERETF